MLRSGTELIKTVLEVFKYDPLFTWTTNPVKVLRAQTRASVPPDSSRSGGGGGDEEGEDAGDGLQTTSGLAAFSGVGTTAELSADRALASVLQKLSPALSVEYTINGLIQEARDTSALAMIFPGWSPHL